MDPAGITMLRSVRIIFEMLGLQPESIKFKKEKFDGDNLVKGLTESPKRCPAIVTILFDGGVVTPHIMVATNALKGIEFIPENGPVEVFLRDQWFINCKNSYRDDPSEPGTVLEILIMYVFKLRADLLLKN